MPLPSCTNMQAHSMTIADTNLRYLKPLGWCKQKGVGLLWCQKTRCSLNS